MGSLTGAAGFVGFHTALQLHEEGDTVLGLDNFNHYYDVRLKRKRAALLERAGMRTLFEGDSRRLPVVALGVLGALGSDHTDSLRLSE